MLLLLFIFIDHPQLFDTTTGGCSLMMLLSINVGCRCERSLLAGSTAVPFPFEDSRRGQELGGHWGGDGDQSVVALDVARQGGKIGTGQTDICIKM